MNKRFITAGRYKTKKAYHETILGKSMTIQGEAYTIKEVIDRATRGLGTAIAKKAIWADAEYFDDIDLNEAQNMDLAEIQELNQEVKDRIKHLSEKLEDEKDTNPDNLVKPGETEVEPEPVEPV